MNRRLYNSGNQGESTDGETISAFAPFWKRGVRPRTGSGRGTSGRRRGRRSPTRPLPGGEHCGLGHQRALGLGPAVFLSS